MSCSSDPTAAGNSPLTTRRTAVLAVVGAALSTFGAEVLAASPAGTIKTVADFDATTWARLLDKGPRPAAYVFTTTYCSTCPDAFDKLHEAIVASHQKVELAAVVMDVQGEQALRYAHHYQGATRIYAFDGFEPAIRQAVDPKWRNVTPYIVLVSASGALLRVTGPPDASALKAWLT